MRVPGLVLMVAVGLSGAGMAVPPMPPSPTPPDAVVRVATAFAVDVDRAEKVERHVRLPYYQRQTRPPISVTVLPPDMLPMGFTEAARNKLPYAYELRRYSQRNQYDKIFQRTGVSYVSMACDGAFPLLDTASNLEKGLAMLLLPSAGQDAHQLHVISFLPNGHLAPASPGAPSGTVHFSDGTQFYDVTVPYDGSPITVTAVIPPDHTY